MGNKKEILVDMSIWNKQTQIKDISINPISLLYNRRYGLSFLASYDWMGNNIIEHILKC